MKVIRNSDRVVTCKNTSHRQKIVQRGTDEPNPLDGVRGGGLYELQEGREQDWVHHIVGKLVLHTIATENTRKPRCFVIPV